VLRTCIPSKKGATSVYIVSSQNLQENEEEAYVVVGGESKGI